MTKSMLSADWYRVADLKPRLRQHLAIHRQHFRGLVWYVMQDPQGGLFHRLSPAAHLMVCLMDGRRTMQSIWTMLGEKLGAERPTQDDCISLMAQLHASDLVICDVTPDLAELGSRSARTRRRRLMSRIRNPLAVQLPMFDPDRFLESTSSIARWVFSWTGLVVWFALVTYGAVLASIHWPKLAGDLPDRLLSAQNALLIALTFPFVKALHELGHGYAVKRWGGEVHEMGIMMLVLMPVPYVDASSSLSFESKWQRACVGAAGIMVEVALAALAMIVWTNVEGGWISAIMFNVMLIGGVSTLLFNGNPLLRFDGYYVLCDLIEIPNLATRANKYLQYLARRHLLGIEGVGRPADAAGERIWFVGYAVAAFIYRLFIMVTIALFVATKFFFFGVALAVWSVAMTVVLPLLNGMRFVLTNPQLRRQRGSAASKIGISVAGIALLVFLLPLPYATVAEGVVWAPDNAHVRTNVDGELVRLIAGANDQVRAGSPLLEMSNKVLANRLTMLQAQRQELEAQLEANLVRDRIQVQMIRARLGHVARTIEAARDDVEGLVVRAAADGRFVLPNPEDLEGRYVQKGELLGFVLAPQHNTVRVVLPQDDVDLVRNRTKRVRVRFASDLTRTFEGDIAGSSPAAISRLPSAALGTLGGGRILTNPSDDSGLTPLETSFEFDVRLNGAAVGAPPGLRAYVKFEHGWEPVGFRIVRAARQVFLAVLNV